MFKKILTFIWMLPQNILGILILFLLKGGKVDSYKDCDIYRVNVSGFSGGSFGRFIILEDAYFKREYMFVLELTKRHEFGHYLQGKILGPLYLIIIGIPSMINNLRARIDIKVRDTYYTRYPENWADKLGEVKR